MNLLDNGKIAILFCGQIRTGVACYPNIIKFLKSTHEMYDTFIHTWDINTLSHHGLFKRDTSLLNKHFPVPHEVIETIKELYKPVDMEVSNFVEEFDKNILYNRIPWLYSFIKVNQMRKRYEQQRYDGFKYRRVVKIRLDQLFEPHHTLNNEIKYSGGSDKLYTCDIWNNLPKKVEDVLWLASSDTMDVMEEWAQERLQNSILTERHTLDWQEHCALFLQDKGIPTHSWLYNKIHVYRDVHEQAGIDINDFDAIDNYETI